MKKLRNIVSLVLTVILLQTVCIIPVNAYQVDTYQSDAQTSQAAIPLAACTITLSQTEYTYDGNAKSPAVTVKCGSTTFTAYSDYTLLCKNNVNAGTATVTIKGNGSSLTGSVDRTFTIKPRSLNDCNISLSQTVFTYDGTAKTPSVTVRYINKTLTQGTDYTVYYTNNINETDSAIVSISGKGNLKDTVTRTFTIIPQFREIPIAACDITLSQTEYTYDGNAKSPAVTVKCGSRTFTSSEYDVSYKDNVNAGTATVTIKGKYNATDYYIMGSIDRTFTIQKRNVSDCSISLSQTVFYYDGTAKTPSVTVKYGSNTLTQGTDYIVSYSNNIDVTNSAAVAVYGNGNFTGRNTAAFAIKPVLVTGISLNKTSTTIQEGKSETLTATVAPSNATNKTVTWSSSNTSVATVLDGKIKAIAAGTATITAKSHNGKTAECTVTVKERTNKFIDGADNWSFKNSKTNFGDTYYMNSEYWDTLLNGLSNTEKNKITERVKNKSWGGSCYGMAVTSILASNGILKPGEYQKGAHFLYDISAKPTNEVKSLINYYFALQYTNAVQQEIYKYFYSDDEKGKLQILLKCLEDDSPTFLCFYGYFYGTRWSGHAVVAYGVRYGTYSYNGRTYNGRILTYDNNSVNYNEDYCLYFNSSDGSWTIPHYKLDSTKKSLLGLITDDMEYINYHGYLDGVSNVTVEEYVATLYSAAIAGDYTVTKAAVSSDIWTSTVTSDDDIKLFSALVDADFEQCDLMFAMKDASSGYIMKTSNLEKLDLSLSYENSLLTVKADNGNMAGFSPDGLVKISGDDTDYTLKMTYNSDYPTDWYTIQVDGSNVDKVSLEKTDEGYVLEADNLNNVKLTFKNDEVSPAKTFSTRYNKVFIYEVNKNTIGLKVDTDNNGTYETDITDQTALENKSVLSAETIGLGDIITAKCSAAGGTGSYTYAVYYKQTSQLSWTAAQSYKANSSVTFKPAKATTYDVCIKVKDSAGKEVKKYFTVSVTAGLQNKSVLSAEEICLGDSVTVSAKASGGTGPYKYNVLYKQVAQSSWTTAQSYNTNANVSFKPAKATDYDVCVKVKDSSGTVTKKFFTVTVIDSSVLSNTSKLSATTVSLGNSIAVRCSASGGTGFYQYAVYYKKTSESKWTAKQSYSSNASVSVKPSTATTYDICVKVKDSDGNEKKKYFTVTVELTIP